MDAESLRKELKQVDDLLMDKIITEQKSVEWKKRVIESYESEHYPSKVDATKPNGNRGNLPDGIAYAPGRFIGAIFGALKNINPERCAGVTPEQQRTKKKPKSPNEMFDDLPDMYK